MQRGTGPQAHAIVVVGSGITCLNVQTACVAHHHGNDLAVRGMPSGHYNVYGDTLLRDMLGVFPGRDFAFPDTNCVKALPAMLSALLLVAGSKHAPRANELTYINTLCAVFLPQQDR